MKKPVPYCGEHRVPVRHKNLALQTSHQSVPVYKCPCIKVFLYLSLSLYQSVPVSKCPYIKVSDSNKKTVSKHTTKFFLLSDSEI